jgi:uncharacterized protein YcaQ
VTKPRLLEAAAARAFVRRATGFDGAFADVASALAHLGFVQMDPINVCGRMHDHVLRHRVRDYAEGDLVRHAHPDAGARSAFEHFLPGQGILATFPLEAWRFIQPTACQRATSDRGYRGKLSAPERKLARWILAEIEQRGALASDEFEHDARATCGWGTNARAVKVLLEKLFAHGEVLIGQRRAFRRVYDLPQRVLPAEVLAAPAAGAQEVQRYRVLARLRQRRLVRLAGADAALVADVVLPITVDGCPRLWCLRTDEALLDADPLPANTGAEFALPRLIAPLDPLIYDRILAARLWQFDYTWEVYTPPAKRTRGYYALPLLAGCEIVGHVDPKADRAARKLRVVGRSVRRGHASAEAVRELARFLGLKA